MTHTLAFEAIGTRWQIEYDAPASATLGIRAAIDQTIGEFDRTFSRFHKESWVSRVRDNPGTHTLPPDAFDLLVLYRDAYCLTDGLVTPLIGTTLEQAGYDAQYSFKTTTLTPVPAFDEALTFTEQTLTTTTRVLLDFGAAGKGYLIDKVGAVLHDAGVTTYVINAGGDMLHAGAVDNAITVGLENPLDLAQVVGTCELAHGSLCASAGSRRYWNEFTHIINPSTLASPRSVAGVWVKAKTAAVADIVSTALFFVEPNRLSERFVFNYAMLDHDMTMTASRGFGLQAFTGGGA
jgi:thiamine biosynthesis lipoprotein